MPHTHKRTPFDKFAKMLVSELQTDERKALRDLVSDVRDLYEAFSAEYMADWRTKVAEEEKEQHKQERPKVVQKVEKACKEVGLEAVARYYPVESNYYDWPLQQRAFRLLAPSEAHMCKSVIMYIAPVNTQKLMHFARDLKERTISKKYYNFRLAPTEVSFELTGFEKGGVCPIGMDQPVPVILAESITKLDPPVLFIGAGHIDWKLALPVQDFIKATNCMITDLA
ncbi:hypothetical protein BCR43DRAFT_470169 [Syncephalastrum racemosum]|uniref:YbaK/aminoacyl-tRNA synthetase-associated domain-containing protein n=1 Tax=Syncephalastrum racemosum TaxID=13706 RepID=A0A1X2HRG2_SYNRA|nr:hypothetical protein BCR43DRAFT_470169 [Syncephalastrum racemosum]